MANQRSNKLFEFSQDVIREELKIGKNDDTLQWHVVSF